MKTTAYIVKRWSNQVQHLGLEPVTVIEACQHCARLAGGLMDDEWLEVRDSEDGSILFHTNKMQHDQVMAGWSK